MFEKIGLLKAFKVLDKPNSYGRNGTRKDTQNKIYFTDIYDNRYH